MTQYTQIMKRSSHNQRLTTMILPALHLHKANMLCHLKPVDVMQSMMEEELRKSQNPANIMDCAYTKYNRTIFCYIEYYI